MILGGVIIILGSRYQSVAAESGIRITKELRVSPSDLTELIVSLGGVKFWIVAIAPLYIGWVLAQPPGGRHLFIDDLRVVLGIIVIGPLLGTFTLLLNVYSDMETTDRVNPRKKYVQVVEELIGQGLIERETLLLASFAWWFIGTIALFLGALYAPTTASDYAADRAFRIRTFAVRFGVTRTLLFGFFLQVLSVAALAIGWSQRWFPFDGPGYDGMAELWPFLGLQVIFYAAFLRRPTVGRIWALLLFLSILQGLGVILMLWRFVGQRGWAP
ncbi:MAG: hypothetical protein E6K15_05025 [Methanobacteriota archaeon]|nr:MAG: hypothetical protein E6K15_05025 [Euryarchaeota archaeon]